MRRAASGLYFFAEELHTDFQTERKSRMAEREGDRARPYTFFIWRHKSYFM